VLIGPPDHGYSIMERGFDPISFDIAKSSRLFCRPVRGKAVAIIPARYDSERLPGKPLLPLAGIPLVIHVARQALQARLVGKVIVATDDQRIFDAAKEYGVEAVITSREAQSGTDRVAEAASSVEAEIIVNVQGDEPLIEPSTIDAAIEPLLENKELMMATTSEPINSTDDVFNPAVVKVVTDAGGYALYFSRSPIPYVRANDGLTLMDKLLTGPGLLSNYRKHSGLYVFRREFLMEFSKMQPSRLEQLEALEQLRALENGRKIRVVEVNHRSIGVDTIEDYEKVKRIIEGTIK
jgi:3-deoxy-manno-octulosonate cytidylyltransferase (CMP-KDO synthetase)